MLYLQNTSRVILRVLLTCYTLFVQHVVLGTLLTGRHRKSNLTLRNAPLCSVQTWQLLTPQRLLVSTVMVLNRRGLAVPTLRYCEGTFGSLPPDAGDVGLVIVSPP